MVLKAEQVSKRYFRKSGEANYFYAVKPVNLTLQPGTVTVVCGRSGSGKTTLLHMLAGILIPSEGKVWMGETDMYSLSDRDLSRLRNRSLGVVPQARSVLDTLTVKENILLPSVLYGTEDRTEEALSWMEKLNILHLAESRAAELSGGELRRAAIARTLCCRPEVVLADEPTGDLDDENTGLVLHCFRRTAEEGAAVLIVSHDMEALNIADQVYRMDNGEMTAGRP